MRLTPYLYIIARKCVGRWLLFVLLLSMACHVHAEKYPKYSREKPLIIMCDWAFPPYEFSNDGGRADGYNVELLKKILKEIDIPHKFVMQEGFRVDEAFRNHEADLIVDGTSHFRHAPYYSSRNILNYYKIKVAANNQEPSISSFIDISPSEPILLKTHDKATREILSTVVPQQEYESSSPNEALAEISEGRKALFVWGEEPINWIIREMNLSNITLHDVSIPVSEMHVVGYDKKLIDEIDDQYSRLEQSGQLEKLRDKWFHPERIHNDSSPVALYFVIIALILTIAMIAVYRLEKSRANQATLRREETLSMMQHALAISQYSTIIYDKPSKLFKNWHGHILPNKGVLIEELRMHIHPDDLPLVHQHFVNLLSGEQQTADIDIRWLPFENEGIAVKDQENPWQIVRGHAFVDTDENQPEQHVIITMKYMTEEVRKEREDSELGSRYTKMFDTCLAPMSFYDKDGWLVDLNQQMRLLCGFDEEGEKYFRQANLFLTPYFRDDFDPKSSEPFHACQHMRFADMSLDKYVEVKVRAITDEKGELNYYTVTAFDVTPERQLYLEQRKHNRELRKVNQQITEYEKQLRYMLDHSETWVWISSLKDQTLVFTRSLQQHKVTIHLQTFGDYLVDEGKEETLEAFGNLKGVDQDFVRVIKFKRSPIDGKPMQSMAVSGFPLHDEDGQLTGHFGIIRDVTSLIEAQEKLRTEKKRADDSGKLKSVFLANMTHELRTPLNAIVGFSDLMQMIDDPGERREFIRIIRNNCDMLLRLINDIIEASSIEQGPIAIDEKEVNFAVNFNDICQTLAQRVQEPGVEFIVDNPYKSFITTIDQGRMQQVITNFTTNAVKYTKEGHIKVGYRYVAEEELHIPAEARLHSATGRKGIYMYCEDTGLGIPKDKQAAVFDRFVKLNDYVQGTGLGLSICKSIADRCKGHIGVSSDGIGHGSTFWIWIPCERKE